MNNTLLDLETTRLNYRRYRFFVNDIFTGRIVLECYDDVWNLELMDVYPKGKGIGTIFLAQVLKVENLKAKNMTVCPISSRSARFFKRNGFQVSNRWD
jgi:hypothetical protein